MIVYRKYIETHQTRRIIMKYENNKVSDLQIAYIGGGSRG